MENYGSSCGSGAAASASLEILIGVELWVNFLSWLARWRGEYRLLAKGLSLLLFGNSEFQRHYLGRPVGIFFWKYVWVCGPRSQSDNGVISLFS